METDESKTAIDRLALAAVYAGSPRDQLEDFLRRCYVPTPKQLEFHAAARLADQPGGPDQIGYGGARGPGKSHAIFAQLALDDCQRRDGLKCLYLRKIGKQAREQLEEMRHKVLFGTPHLYNRSSGLITIPQTESKILVGHFSSESDVDAYLGLEYDVIAIEEATTLTLTKYLALRDSNRTSRTDWRPRVYNSTNPSGIGHGWYKERFILPYRHKTDTYTRFIPGTLDDNPFIDPGYRRKVEENIGWRLRAYRYGDWDIAAGQFFSNWDEELHVIEPFEFPLEWQFWCALDYGFTHPTVCHLFARSGDGDVYVVDEFAARRQLVPQNARGIKTMLERNGLSLSSLDSFVAGADVFSKTGAAQQTIAEQYLKEGIELTPAKQDRINGAAVVMQMLGDAENNIPQRLSVFNRCNLLIRTMPTLVHNPNNPEDVLKVDADEDGQGGDDAYDSLRYGLMEKGGAAAEVGRSPIAGYRG